MTFVNRPKYMQNTNDKNGESCIKSQALLYRLRGGSERRGAWLGYSASFKRLNNRCFHISTSVGVFDFVHLATTHRANTVCVVS